MVKLRLIVQTLLLVTGLAGCVGGPEPAPPREEDLSNPSLPDGVEPAAPATVGTEQWVGNTAFIGTLVPDPVDADRDQPLEVEKATFPKMYTQWVDGAIALPSRDTHLCTLTDVEGITGANTLVRVRYYDDGLQELLMMSTDNNMIAEAACVPKSYFFNNSASPISQIFPTNYGFINNGSSWYNSEWGNAALLLSGFGGPFRWMTDDVHVDQAAVNAQNVARFSSGSLSNYITIYTTAFWFNESSGPQKPIMFIGPLGRGTAANSGQWSIRQNSTGSATVRMVPVTDAFCYFSRVAGRLETLEDRIRIYANPNTGYYELYVKNTSGRRLDVAARCMAYDQR